MQTGINSNTLKCIFAIHNTCICPIFSYNLYVTNATAMVLVIRTDWNDIGILKLSNCVKKNKRRKPSRTPLLEAENINQQREKANKFH